MPFQLHTIFPTFLKIAVRSALGKQQGKARPLVRPTVHGNFTLMGLDNPVDYCQPQSGAFGNILCRKKRVKNLVDNGRINSVTAIGNRQTDISACGNILARSILV